jgi:hypothetical protein
MLHIKRSRAKSLQSLRHRCGRAKGSTQFPHRVLPASGTSGFARAALVAVVSKDSVTHSFELSERSREEHSN